MFGDVYSNRGFAGETAGSSPGYAPGVHSPVRTRVLLVADEGGQPDGEPSTPNATASTRRGFVPVAEGAPGSVAGHENPASGSLGNGASSLSEALLASHEGSRIDERVFRDEKRVASPTGAPAASDDETEPRRHRQQNTPIAGSIHMETNSVRGGGGGGAFPRVDSLGLFRDPASLDGLRGARGGARYAFDPWTKLPVRIESFDPSRADSEPRGRLTTGVGIDEGTTRYTGVRAVARLIIRNRIKWCWHVASPSWWVAFFYLLGSVGFAAGGFASCLNAVAGSRRRYFVFEVAPYTCGGLAFLIATALLVYTSWTARYGEPGRAERRRVAKRHAFLSRVSVVPRCFFGFFSSVKRLSETSTSSHVAPNTARTNARVPHETENALPPSFWELRAAVGERGVVGDPLTQPLMDADVSELYGLSDAMEEARRLWLANDSWTRRRRALELVSSGLILLGVLLYKVMVFTMFARCVFPDSIPWSAKRELFLYTAPSVVGSLFFVAGSYVLWCAVNRTWSPPSFPTNLPTTIAWLSVVGSVLYLIGSLPPALPSGATSFLSFGLDRRDAHIGSGGQSDAVNQTHANVVASILTPEWPFTFAGFFLGSLVFAAQSALMIHEIAESLEREA